MVSRRRTTTAIVALAAGLALGCGEYAHRNPYDPETETRIVIAGPDTLWSIGEMAQYTATVSPTIPGGLGITWELGMQTDPALSGGRGLYRAVRVGTASVIASVGRHAVAKRVVVVQRPARVAFFCPDRCTSLGMPTGTTRELLVGQYDALGTGLHFTQPRSPVTYAIRDPDIAAIVAGTAAPTGVSIRGVTPGTTYVFAQLGEWKDSARVTVFTP